MEADTHKGNEQKLKTKVTLKKTHQSEIAIKLTKPKSNRNAGSHKSMTKLSSTDGKAITATNQIDNSSRIVRYFLIYDCSVLLIYFLCSKCII